MKAMILAAGFGERLRPLTDTTPKPLLPINGKPLLQYHIERLARAGVRELVINTSWLGEQIEAFVGDGSRFGVQVAWSRETQPLETGGGIRRALPLLGCEPFLVINGDVWSTYSYSRLVERGLEDNVDAHLVLVDNPDHHQHGDFELDDAGRVRYPGFHGVDPAQTGTFSGISLMRPELFALHPSASESFPLRNALRSSIEAGCVSGERFTGVWRDVGTVERLAELNTLLTSGAVEGAEKPKLRVG